MLLNGGNLAGRLVAGPTRDRIGSARALHLTAAALLAAGLADAVDYGAVAWALAVPASAFWLLAPVALRQPHRQAVG